MSDWRHSLESIELTEPRADLPVLVRKVKPERPDLRLLPLAGLAWLGAASGALSNWWAGVGLLVLLAVVAVGYRVRTGNWLRWFLAAGVVCAASFAIAAGQAYSLRNNPVAQLASQNKVVDVKAKIAADSVQLGFGAKSQRTELKLLEVSWSAGHWQGELSGQLQSKDQQLAVGELVSFTAQLSMDDGRSPAELSCRLIGPVRKIDQPAGLIAWANDFRAGLRETMLANPLPAAKLVPSLVVGDTTLLPAKLVADFKTTGLSHLCAVSGTNFTLMLLFVVGTAKYLGLRAWPVRVVSILVAGLFILLCRGEPSVLRAGAMGAVTLASTGFSSTPKAGLHHLGLVALVLLLGYPSLALSWGFALSVAACLGILWWVGQWQQNLEQYWPNGLVLAFVVPLAAQLATLPLIAALAGRLSLAGILANLLAAIFVGPVTVSGMLTGIFAQLRVDFLAQFFGWLAAAWATPIVKIAELGAQLPTASFAVPNDWLALVIISLLAFLLGYWVFPAVFVRRGATVALVMALIISPMVPFSCLAEHESANKPVSCQVQRR